MTPQNCPWFQIPAAKPLFEQHRQAMSQVEAALKNKSADACGIGSLLISAQAAADQIKVVRQAITEKQLSVLTPEQRTKYEAYQAARGRGPELSLGRE